MKWKYIALFGLWFAGHIETLLFCTFYYRVISIVYGFETELVTYANILFTFIINTVAFIKYWIKKVKK